MASMVSVGTEDLIIEHLTKFLGEEGGRKETEFRFFESVGEKTRGQVAARGRRNKHVPLCLLALRLCSTPAFVPHFGVDRAIGYTRRSVR